MTAIFAGQIGQIIAAGIAESGWMGPEMEQVGSEVFGGVATGIPYTSMGTAGGAILGFAAVLSVLSFNVAYKRMRGVKDDEAEEGGSVVGVSDAPSLDEPLLRTEAP
mmetsp:Transcript_59051/g.111294  ORF Transcript_59051/g.111294 Transcript_59051/m.111294 type:complete len:107 (+) Transcript_59051:77-397(+)